MKEYEFIAFAISHWHAIGVDSFIYDLSKKLNKKPKGKIIIEPHHEDGFIIKETDFICKNFADVEFYFAEQNKENSSAFTKIKKILKIINEKKNKKDAIVYLVFPKEPFIETIKQTLEEDQRYPTIVLIDEGIGTYFSPEVYNKASKAYKTKKDEFSFFAKFKLATFRYVGSILDKVLMKDLNIKTRFLFEKNNILKANKEIIESYRKVMDYRKKTLKINNNYKKIVILITEPLSEYHHLSLDDELHLIKLIIKYLDKEGYHTVLKAHPREKKNKYAPLEKYNVEIIPNDFPVEDIFPALNPICVISYSSTALVNAKIFYDITSVSINDMLTDFSDEFFKMHSKEFKKLTKDYINFISEIEELGDLIR